jgi:hypothetical protein
MSNAFSIHLSDTYSRYVMIWKVKTLCTVGIKIKIIICSAIIIVPSRFSKYWMQFLKVWRL